MESGSVKQCQAIAVRMYGSVYKPRKKRAPFKLLSVYGCCMEPSPQMYARGLELLSVCGREGILAPPSLKTTMSQMQCQESVSEASEGSRNSDWDRPISCQWLGTTTYRGQLRCSSAHCESSVIIPRQDEPMPYWGTLVYNANTFEHIRTRPSYKHPILLNFPQEHLEYFDTATSIGSDVGYKRNQEDGCIDFWVKNMCDSVGNVLPKITPQSRAILIIQIQKYIGKENQVLLHSISTSSNMAPALPEQSTSKDLGCEPHPATACTRLGCKVVAFHKGRRAALCSRHHTKD